MFNRAKKGHKMVNFGGLLECGDLSPPSHRGSSSDSLTQTDSNPALEMKKLT